MIIEIQCLPRPTGTDEDRYAHVHAAIGVIEASGLTFEVGALGTTVEGTPDELWPLARQVHEACLTAGAENVISVVKVAQSADEATGATIAGLVDRYRS
ncbi:MAG: thiamine-binding protein [Acidimicrobiales bacterium]